MITVENIQEATRNGGREGWAEHIFSSTMREHRPAHGKESILILSHVTFSAR